MPAGRRRFGRRGLIIAVAAVIVALIILGAAATFYTDLLWFREVRYTNVFWTQIRVKIALGVVFGAIFAAALLVNLWVVQKVTSPHRLFTLKDQVLERYRATLRPYVRWAVVGVALLFGLFAGSGATSQWRSWLLFRHGAKFGSTDPVFHKDLGFYVFHLPFYRFVFAWTFSTLLVVLIVTAVGHYFMGGIRLDQRGGRATPQVKVHLSVLLALIVLLKAWGYRLDQYGLVVSPRGVVTGASYTDLHAHLPALRLLVIMAILVTVIILVNIRFRGWILPVAGIGLLFLISILAGGVYPAAVQRLRVTPAERVKEAPYIQRNINATRTAFGIDDQHVTVQQFQGASDITPKVITDNPDTVQNLRLWSPDVLIQTMGQLQKIRQYYEFNDVDVDRYTVNGKVRQVMVAPREISQANIPPGSRSWQNTHLTYTHGYGVVASLVDTVTSQGTPDFIIQDSPPVVSSGAPSSPDWRIYFGESSETPYVLVKTQLQELDYPSEQASSGFVSTSYAGTGGIRLSGLRRLAFAWRFRDANLLLSSSISGNSRILFRRDVQDRIQQIAPFLQLDHDPYLVVTPTGLQWIQDAYTTTDMYPYSQRVDLGGITGPSHLSGVANYIRNSVKVAVDAVNGSMTLYVADATDPIIQTWEKIFPTNFKQLSDAPAWMQQHVRYPEDLFTVQASQYQLYHMTNAISFYTREDAWSLPKDPSSSNGGNLPPFYMLMKPPGAHSLEYVLMLPFTPNNRPNMTAWVAAESGYPGPYGSLLTYEVPKNINILGPEQVEAQINVDPDFSRQRTLLGSVGSNLIFGNMLTVPLGNSLLYVQPIYLGASSSNQIPELKYVVAVQGNNVGLGTDLPTALANLVGTAPPPSAPPPPTKGKTAADFIAEALQHYQASQDALKRGDFATYGREQAAMATALANAAKASGVSPSPSPTPSPGA